MTITTTLGYALLGLIRDEPRSGYALRKVFETTPMGNYSSSPGSIYPALKALQKDGLVEARPAEKGQIFHLSEQGLTRFNAWLSQEVDIEMVARQMSAIMLRFAFLTGHPDRTLTYRLLSSLQVAARAQADGLAAWLGGEAGQDMPLQPRLAVDQGRRNFVSIAEWAADALQQLSHAGEAHT